MRQLNQMSKVRGRIQYRGAVVVVLEVVVVVAGIDVVAREIKGPNRFQGPPEPDALDHARFHHNNIYWYPHSAIAIGW
jgi:hypothetical protein